MNNLDNITVLQPTVPEKAALLDENYTLGVNGLAPKN
jgi:hypothetical protein